MKMSLQILRPRALRFCVCRRNSARPFFGLRRRRERSTLRALIAEARDLRLVMHLLLRPLRLFLVPFGRSLLPLLDCRFLLLTVLRNSSVEASVCKAENCCKLLQSRTRTVDELGAS